jgi:hypothetical protein
VADKDIIRPLLVISDERVPTAAYQAIYHRMTAKVERLSEIFRDTYTVKVDDISQFHNFVQQAILQFKPQAQKTEITVSLRKGESHTFSDFQKFCNFNFSSTCATSKIVYEIDFFTVLPVEIKEAEDIVQRFKMSLMIDQDFIDDNHEIPAYLFSRIAGNNISLSIEYADYSVARNLQGIVRDWVESLPGIKKSSMAEFWSNRADFFNFFVPRVLPFGVLMGASYTAINGSINSLSLAAQFLLFSLGLAIVSQILGHVLVVQFYRAFNESVPLTFILLTEGDRRRYGTVKKKRARRAKWMGIIAVSVFIGFFVSLFASYIFQRYLT